jgi:hypothetical protein
MTDIARGAESRSRNVEDIADEVCAFATSPARFFGGSWHAMHHMEPERLSGLQLAAVRMRFAELKDRIPTLTVMADELGTSEISELDDVVPLLFQHSVYKSYPPSLLEKNRFGHLTRWLDGLTTHDLSEIDVSGCDGIDSWLDTLDATTELRVAHSSATTGTMSFLPRGLDDWDRMCDSLRCGLYQISDPLGERDHSDEYFNLIWPQYRYGRSAVARVPDLGMKQLLGSEDRFHAMRQGRLSSDAMYLAGRMRAASARGELDRLEISPALKARREEFERARRELTEGMPRFLEQTIDRLKGERIWMMAPWNVLYDMARAGLERGLEGVFAADSVVTTGGGAKGQTPPADWEDVVKRFIGVERLQQNYGMSEITALNKICEHDRYHFEPWIVPFLLDPDSGVPLPRRGIQTGRMACFDVLPASYWGGFITGDEVTADWSPCGCGKTTPHIERTVERYSEKRGGDDKITCAASDDAHRAALELLTEPTSFERR